MTHDMHRLLGILVGLSLSLALGCGSGGGPSPEAVTPEPTEPEGPPAEVTALLEAINHGGRR